MLRFRQSNSLCLSVCLGKSASSSPNKSASKLPCLSCGQTALNCMSQIVRFYVGEGLYPCLVASVSEANAVNILD